MSDLCRISHKKYENFKVGMSEKSFDQNYEPEVNLDCIHKYLNLNFISYLNRRLRLFLKISTKGLKSFEAIKLL